MMLPLYGMKNDHSKKDVFNASDSFPITMKQIFLPIKNIPTTTGEKYFASPWLFTFFF